MRLILKQSVALNVSIGFLISAMLATSASAAQKGCQLSQRDFIGNWQERVAAGEAADDRQDVQFAVEGGRRIFRSWLHQRPDMFGTWAFSDCQMKVSGPSGIELTFRLSANAKGRLVELDSGVGYRRIR